MFVFFLYIAGINMAANFFGQQPASSAQSKSAVNVLPESNSYFSNQPSEAMATAQVGGKETEKSSYTDDTISGHKPEFSDEHTDDSLYHSLADELSGSNYKKTLETTDGPHAEISGKLPKKDDIAQSNVFSDNDQRDDISSESAQQRGGRLNTYV